MSSATAAGTVVRGAAERLSVSPSRVYTPQSYRTGVYSRMLQPRSKIHIAFEIGVVLKGINGLLELIGGFVLLWIGPGTLQNLMARLTQNELIEDPRDFIATQLREAAGHLSANAQLFAAIYLLAHGVI